ncbi:hypothetical protein [Anaeromyxobacter oryzae]|uniref:Uncharacterized protein n=1 Tax=Anaeromyxobacter oryzae TaxID=2918170 RepID=A0ABM7X1A1_9BACT|nr:hypothetical protein [Anaeromyxobacter oryzae]BDG05562.1 hypothetical protein AMOR_45580 [Anaeromyxobacter oryzae]
MRADGGSRLAWGRGIAIAVRTVHLGAMAVLVGGVQLAAPRQALHPWLALTAASGLALLALEARHSRHWPYQARGVLTFLHLGAPALLLVPALPGRAATLAALALGAVGSHLPRAVRKWSFRHRCVVD